MNVYCSFICNGLPNWEQFKCLSRGELINKFLYIHVIQISNKNNKHLMCTTAQMYFKTIILNERSQAKKEYILYYFIFIKF